LINFSKNTINWNHHSLNIIPITEYSFSKANIKRNTCLNHKFRDISFFPTWQEFLNRSTGKNPDYPNYMTFLLTKPQIVINNKEQIEKHGEIIGILAVQLINYDSLKIKNKAAIYSIKNYLYLSWIALEHNFQSTNYFSLLFEYYYSLIRYYRNYYKKNIEGATIIIRRMRPVIWSLLNDKEECPQKNDHIIKKVTPRVRLNIVPSEFINKSILLKQDHILILFKERKSKSIQQF
jgi:hypothetical protein